LPKSDPEWTAALVRSLFAPPVFADLRSKNGDQLPLSVRHALVTQEFAPHAVDDIIKLYMRAWSLFAMKVETRLLAGAKGASPGRTAYCGVSRFKH
jgi:hypothetical protein